MVLEGKNWLDWLEDGDFAKLIWVEQLNGAL